MAFFKKKEVVKEEPKQETLDEAMFNENLEAAMFGEDYTAEPEVKEPEVKEPEVIEPEPIFPDFSALDAEAPVDEEPDMYLEEPKTLLEAAEGVEEIIDVADLAISKFAVKTDEIIVRKNGDRYEVLGRGPLKVKVIEGSKEEISLMLFDHKVKTTDISEKEKLAIYKYEVKNSDLVEKLSGKTPAELNGVTDDYFASMLVRDSVDERLRGLATDALLEAAKLPKEVQDVLAPIVEVVGPDKVSAEAVKDIAKVGANENMILMMLIKHSK